MLRRIFSWPTRSTSLTNYAGGVGIRYAIVEKQKLNIGVDVTYGGDEYGVYTFR